MQIKRADEIVSRCRLAINDLESEMVWLMQHTPRSQSFKKTKKELEKLNKKRILLRRRIDRLTK